MDAQGLEYDRFGPWVLEVAASDPPPSIFAPYLVAREVPILALKVPRHIERRDARPGMDLYDYLICLYQNDIAVLQRQEREVRVRTCRYCEIGHLSVTRTLLYGNLRLGFPGGACDLPFNTTADEPIHRAVRIIRDRCHGQSSGIGPARGTGLPAEDDVDDPGLSFYFRHLLADLRLERPSVRLMALQDTVPLGVREVTAIRRLLHRATGKRLLESMHCSDGEELTIVDRGQRYAYRWESMYGDVTSYVPLAKIRTVDWQDDVAGQVTTLTIGTEGGAISNAFTLDNPSIDGYRAYLAGLPAPGGDQAATLRAA